MGTGDADETRFSINISPADADTQANRHALDPSISISSMTSSGIHAPEYEDNKKKLESESEMQTQCHRFPPDKPTPRHPLPLVIPRASTDVSQSPEQSSSPSNDLFPMSPSPPSSRPPPAPTPTPISATQTASHPLLLSHSPLAATDVDGRGDLQPIATTGTTAKLNSPKPQLDLQSSQLDPLSNSQRLTEISREANGILTKRISGGKLKQSEDKDKHVGSPDAATPHPLLPPSSKTPLIDTKTPTTPTSSLSHRQSPSTSDSSLLSFLFCCTRGGHPSTRSSNDPQRSPGTNSTPTSGSLSPTSNGTAGRVPVHGHTGTGFGTLSRFLPAMSRKGMGKGKKKSKHEGKEQARLLQKPGDLRKVAATDVRNLPSTNGCRIDNYKTGRIDSSPLSSGSSRDPTANIITSVSPGKPPTTAVRRRSSVYGGHHGRPGKSLLRPLDAEDIGKKCLVLDLDETLVHSSFKMLSQADFVVPVEIEAAVHNVYVVKRPGVDTFLKKMGELFEVVVFTASLAKYADPVLDRLDKHKVVKHRLFRESCYNHKGNYVKDLSQLGRDIRSVIIIDNSPTSYIFHPTNAVPITSWFNDPLDTELLDLMPFLEDLTMVENVTVVLDQGGS